ncbi:hypothetical protein V4B17_02905 [Bartonella sp. B23]
MIDRNHHTYDKYIASEKKEREQLNSIARGILAIVLGVFVVWLIFSFLGSFFEKYPEHISRYNTTESNQTMINPGKDSN